MKGNVQTASARNTVVPEDLAECLGAVRLTHLALEAVQGDETSPGEFRAGPALQSYRHRMLLTLLTYAYARGIYGSEEIQERVRTDGDLRYLCALEFPEAETLRQFRRREGARLGLALTRLLIQAASRLMPDALFDAATEASKRMEHAAAADSLALDC